MKESTSPAPGPGPAHPEPEPRPAAPLTEGFRSDPGYEAPKIVSTADGPKFNGPVPDRIGVEPDMLAMLPPAYGEFRMVGGYLRLLDVEFRQIGWDGHVHVFERVK